MNKRNNKVDFVIEVLNFYLIFNKNLEDKLKYNHLKWIQKNSNLLINIEIATMLSWMFGGFIYILITIFQSIIFAYKFILQIIELIIIEKSINAAYPFYYKVFNFKLMLWFSFTIFICSILIILLNVKKQNFKMIKELDVIIHIIKMLRKSININKWILYLYFIFTAILSVSTYLFFNNFKIDFIVAFWSSIFLLIYTYGTIDENETKAKKFLLYIIVAPVTLMNTALTTSNIINDPIKVMALVVTLFFTLDMIANSYMDYRKHLFDGEEITFLIGSFDEDDFNKLDKKLRIFTLEDAIRLDKLNILGLISLYKESKDIELAKKCFETSLNINEKDNIALYYLAYILFKTNSKEYIREALNLFQKVKENQINDTDEIKFLDVNIFISACLLKTNSEDLDNILHIINQSEIITSDFLYIKAICYIRKKDISKVDNIRKYLNDLKYFNDVYTDIPYWQASLELLLSSPNYVRLRNYIEEAEKAGIDCSDLKAF